MNTNTTAPIKASQSFTHYYSQTLAVLKTGESAMIVAETLYALANGTDNAWVESYSPELHDDYHKMGNLTIVIPFDAYDPAKAQASIFKVYQPKYNELARGPAQPAASVEEPAQPAASVEEPAQPAASVEEPAQPAASVEEPAQPAATNGPSLLDWLIQQFALDQKTIDLAHNYIAGGNQITIFEVNPNNGTLRGKVQKNAAGAWYSASVIHGKHQCSCRDAADNTKPLPCKHVVALAIAHDNGQGITSQAAPTHSAPRQASHSAPRQASPAQPSQPSQPTASAANVTVFQQRVSKRIAGAIMKIAKRLQDMIADGLIPIMLGSTGTGKSSAARYLAQLLGAGYEEICLNSSFTEADLYGIQVNAETRIAGIIARTFARARAGEVMVCNIDEFYRANRRIQDLFMGLLLPVDAATARARGIDTNEPIFIGESAVWGVEWAPAKNVKWVMGANPWGQVIDPAFARRVQPMTVTFDEDVLQPFAQPYADKVKQIWDMVDRGELPIGLEYGQLARTKNENDERIFPNYLAKLGMIDNSPQKTLMGMARSVLCPVITAQ